MRIATDPSFWERPLVRRLFPTPIAGRVIELLHDAERLLARLERQPETLSHLDTHCVNLFARIGDQGQEQAVVTDWSFLGIAAVGEDLGMQISGNLYGLQVDPADARPYFEAALDAYLAGLRDSGWRGASDAARLAAATAASLRLVPFGLERLRELLNSEERVSWADRLAMEQGCTVEEILPHWGQAIIFLLDLADGAWGLAGQV